MRIEIVAVGSELLTPEFQDTDAVFLTRRLNDLGLAVARRTIVGDRREDVAAALSSALAAADLILVTGGLGPTGDDLTREAAADALGRGLKLDAGILAWLEERFRSRGWEMTPSNRSQAWVIEGAEVLANRMGTAPGLWIEDGPRRLVLLPGPPRELEAMFDEHVGPRLRAGRRGFAARRVLRTTGLGESEVEDRIRGLYPESRDMELTVLARPGQVELRVRAYAEADEAAADAAADALAGVLKERLGDFLFSETGQELEEVVARRLIESGRTLSVAESCSGGLLSHRLTNVAGSSAFFLSGFVVYSNAAKTEVLGVPEDLIRSRGAVSAEVAEAMAAGARLRGRADFALALTGIAGPSGGSPEKPVGLVFIALAGPGGPAEVVRNHFFGGREQIKYRSSQKALDMLRRRLGPSAGVRP